MHRKNIAIVSLSLLFISSLPAGAQAVFLGTMSGDGKRRSYPSMGVTLTSFKTSFISSMQHAASRQKSIQQPQEHDKDGELAFSFPDHISLRVFAADHKSVSQLIMVSRQKNPAQFWRCTEAILTALNPTMTTGDKESILVKLGKKSIDDIPTEEKDVEYGLTRITFARAGDGWVLQGWPSDKALGIETHHMR